MEIFGDSSVDNCSMKAINMTPSLQEPKHKSPKVKKKRKMRKKTYFTRKKYKKNSKNSSKKQSTLKTLHKLCKPVVSVTRLSASEIKQWCEKDSSPCQVENVSTQSKKSKSKHKVQKSKKFTRRKIDKQNHLYSKNNSKNDMKSPNTLSSQETDIRNKKLLIEDLLKNIKQPYMKLQRIDQVINKIAQSFAKTIIVTECEASIQTEYKTNVQTEEIKEIANRSIKEIETQTELNVSVPEVQKLSLGNINTDVCPQNPEIEEVAVNSHTNEILQLNECTDSSFIFNSDTEIVRNAHKKCFKRKRKVICESDTDDSNDNANNSEIILNEVKKLRTSSPEKINKMNIVSEKHDVIKTKCIDENSKLSPKLLTSGESDKKSLILQENVDVPPQKLSILEKLSRLCDPDDDDDDDDGDGDDDDDDDDDDDEDDDDDDDDDDDNGDGDDEDDDDDGDDNDNDNDVNDDDSDNISSSVSSTLNFECVAEDSASIKVRDDDTISVEKSIFKKIQESVQESFYSDKDFLQRYEIFKELKVFLIKLDALKDLHTKYSAIEIEKITNKLMNSFVNLNSSKIQHNNQKSIDKISFTSGISKDSNVNFEKSVVYTIPEKIQTITESPKNSSEKSSNLIRNMDRNKRLKIKKASHNLKDIFEDKSRNRQNVIGNLKQNSNVPTPAIKSSSQESTNKTSELLNMIENVNVNKSTNTMSSLEKQKLEIPSTENSVKSVTDVRFPEKAEINTPQITNFKSHFSNQNEVEQTTFVSKTHKKSTNIIATNISVPTCYSSTMSSKKHNKPKDKKDTKNLTYKCIVCDFCFEDYSNLQLHLIIHTQKQIDSSLNTSNTLTEKSEETISQSSEVPELSQMSEHKHVEYASLQCESNKQEKKKNTIPKSLLNKKRRKNKIQRISNSNECSICSKIFPTATDLAAHIFLHTEKELQKAYKSGKQKLVKSKSTEKEKCKQTRTEQIEETGIEQNLESARTTGSTTVDNIDNTIEGIHKISDKEESFLVQKSNRLITKDPEIRDTESTVLKEHDSQSIKLDLLTKSSKEKINKTGSYKRAVTVCKCHNKPGINENNLQIEIVLLCHTCKVLFRSMECFETHYRLSEYTKCNQNRLTSSRSPNLFCANCGMMFSSVQDVRHHLETHVRFKQNCIMDFRCNICKVIFLGIGTLFYIHWSKHSRNPFWMASEQSFPKNSIINSKLKKIDNPCTQNAITLNSSGEQYIQVAEHVCNNCKLPFVTQDDLKNHDPRCKEFKTLQDTSVVENNSRVIIRMNCSLCNDTFINKKREFYNHIKNKHNCNIDPQFVCVSFSVAKVVYICNVCMAMTENLDAFENHWLKHNTTHINFTCAHCNNIYYNNLNSFIDHAEEHKSNTVVSCTINYTKAELICKFCDTGFDSSQDMYEHIVTHNISSQQTHSKIDQITNQDSPASTSQTNCASTSVKNVGKEIEKSPQMEAQVMEERSKTSPLRSNIDKDKEKLIRVLEGSEDDSENELIIDLARQPEESNEISTGKENREKQTTSNLTSDESSIDQTCAMSENNITKTLITNTNVQVSSQNISLSEPTENVIDFTARNINPQISLDAQTSNSSVKSTSVLQNSHSNNISNNLQDAVVKTTNNESVMKDVKIIENSESHDAILTGKQEELTTLTKESPKKQSLPRPKGFLRVKTLAELTGSAHFCKLCNCAIENANELAKHFKNHKDNSDHEIREKELTSKPLETNKFEKSLGILEKTLTKSNTTVANSQKPQQLQTNTIQDRHLPSLQNITSAYHKNLPPYNFVRRTTAISRSTTSKSDAMPIKVNTSNISNSHTNIPDVQRTRVTSSINGNKQNPAVVTNSSNHLSYQKQNLEYWTQRKKLEKIDNRTMRPTEMIPATNQNSELYQQIIQTRIECAPSPVYSQYSFTAGTSNNSNQMPKQNQTKIVSQPVTANTSSVYYKSPRHGNGSMSIVINQTAPIQNICGIPTIGILQQPAQQQLYQQQVYSEPVGVMNTGYAQQSQNLVDCSEPNSYHLINNQYGISNRQPNVEVTAYEVRYICPYCVKNFLSNDLMQIHINDAHNFVCNICHLRLYNLNDLHLHKFKHKNYVNLM